MIFWGGIYSWFEREEVVTKKRCQSCLQLAELRSFNCLQVLHAYNVPVIPIGRWQVWDDCSKCDAKNQSFYWWWNRKRKRAIAAAYARYNQSSGALKSITGLLDVLTEFAHHEEAAKVATSAINQHLNNMELLRHFSLWLGRHGHLAHAKSALLQLLAVEPGNSEANFQLGRVYTEQGWHVTSVPYLLRVNHWLRNEEVHVYVTVATNMYEGDGKTASIAWQLLETAHQCNPHAAVENKHYRKLVQKLKKELNVEDVITKDVAHQRNSTRLGLLIGLGSALALIALLAWMVLFK